MHFMKFSIFSVGRLKKCVCYDTFDFGGHVGPSLGALGNFCDVLLMFLPIFLPVFLPINIIQ